MSAVSACAVAIRARLRHGAGVIQHHRRLRHVHAMQDVRQQRHRLRRRLPGRQRQRWGGVPLQRGILRLRHQLRRLPPLRPACDADRLLLIRKVRICVRAAVQEP